MNTDYVTIKCCFKICIEKLFSYNCVELYRHIEKVYVLSQSRDIRKSAFNQIILEAQLWIILWTYGCSPSYREL